MGFFAIYFDVSSLQNLILLNFKRCNLHENSIWYWYSCDYLNLKMPCQLYTNVTLKSTQSFFLIFDVLIINSVSLYSSLLLTIIFSSWTSKKLHYYCYFPYFVRCLCFAFGLYIIQYLIYLFHFGFCRWDARINRLDPLIVPNTISSIPVHNDIKLGFNLY